MTNQTLVKIIAALTALWISACGVKGPPEPPLINEASVKRVEESTAGTANTTTNEPAASPVIFPKKDEKKTDKKPPGKKTDKPAATETKDKQGQ